MRQREQHIRGFILVAMVLMAFIFFVSTLFAAGPGTITYQGTVTEPGGTTPPYGPYAMRFALWDVESGGTIATNRKWQETHSSGNAVPLNNGCYSVELGSLTSFPANFFQENANLWLEVEVDLDGDGFEPSEVYSPRVPFTAAPYAFQSDRATTATFAQSTLKSLIRNFVVESGETVSAGDVVVFINGSVRKGSRDPDFGSEYVYNSASTAYNSAAALSETKFVVAYRDDGNSAYGTAIVGDVSRV